MISKIPSVSERGKSGKIYIDLLGNIEFDTPSRFVQSVLIDRYVANYKSNPSINGKVFEFCIIECLIQMDIVPFYYQALMSLIPNVNFDIVCYNDISPVVLSCKVSLRERWKQADLEGLAIKQVYRKSKVHLITAAESEQYNLQKKIKSGNVNGLDSCILAQSPEFDNLLTDLTKQDFIVAKEINPIQRGTLYSNL
ncbi:MAG: hypothetical protein OXE59_10040 [Bacteroidetes bacterium]|nr:hypothetical protein [Bacteroidota bacterium]